MPEGVDVIVNLRLGEAWAAERARDLDGEFGLGDARVDTGLANTWQLSISVEVGRLIK